MSAIICVNHGTQESFYNQCVYYDREYYIIIIHLNFIHVFFDMSLKYITQTTIAIFFS